MSDAELTNVVEAVAEVGKNEEPPPRLAYLREADLEPLFRVRPSCRLHRDGKLLLVAVEGAALGRIDGAPRRLGISGPVGPSGGYFTAPGTTVSVGRLAQYRGAAQDYAPGWLAGVTVGGDPKREPERLQARWVCSR